MLDTHVLISAALSRQGSPHALLQNILERERLVFSDPTFEELRTRLYRPKFDRYIDLDMRERILRDLQACSKWVVIDSSSKWSRDPDDDKFIATALGAPSAVLVSGDQDALSARRPAGLRILTPAQALGEFEVR